MDLLAQLVHEAVMEYQDLWALLDPLVQLVLQASQAVLAPRVTLDQWVLVVQLVLKVLEVSLVLWVLLAQWVFLVMQVPMVSLDQRVQWVPQVSQVHLAFQEHVVWLAHQVQWVLQVFEGSVVTPVPKVSRVSPVPKASLVMLDLQVPLVHLVNKASRVLVVMLVFRDFQELLAKGAPLVTVVSQAVMEQLVAWVHLADVVNLVLLVPKGLLVTWDVMVKVVCLVHGVIWDNLVELV